MDVIFAYAGATAADLSWYVALIIPNGVIILEIYDRFLCSLILSFIHHSHGT